MPVITGLVSEHVQHIYQPIALQVFDRILIDSGLKPLFKDHILFKTDMITASVSWDKHRNPNIKNNYVICNMKPSIDPRDLKYGGLHASHFNGPITMKNDYFENYPVFYDPGSDALLQEHFLPTQLTMDVEFNFNQSIQAYDSFMKLMTMYTNGDAVTISEVLYDYALPEDIIMMLYKIAKLRKKDGAQFVPWLKYYSSDAIGVNLARHKNNRELIVQKKISDLVIQIEFNSKPDEDTKAESFTKFTATITVAFTRPNMLYLRYPIVIMNELLPEDMLSLNRGNSLAPTKDVKHPIYTFDRFMKAETKHFFRLRRYRMPWYDEWMVPSDAKFPKMGQKDWFIAAFTLDNLDDPDGVTEIDLKADLGGIRIHPLVLKLMMRQSGKDLLRGAGRFGVCCYSSYQQMNPNWYELSDDLVLRVKTKLKHKFYHVVLSEKEEYFTGAGMEVFRFDGKYPTTYSVKQYPTVGRGEKYDWEDRYLTNEEIEQVAQQVERPEGITDEEYQKLVDAAIAQAKYKKWKDHSGFIIADKIIVEEVKHGISQDFRVCVWDIVTCRK